MRARPLPTELSRRPFDVHSADRAGVHRQRLRRIDLLTPSRSLRWHRRRPPSGVERIRAHRPVLLPGQFISHVSAAVLWGLPLPVGVVADDPVHVTSIRPAPQMRRRGVTGHRTTADRATVRTRWGMPTSAPASAWVECGALLDLDDLVVLADAILVNRACATTLDDLVRALGLRGRCPGVRRLRAALELARHGAGSPQETRARLAIARSGLPEPELQVDLYDEHGQFVGRVDFAYRHERIVIEYEGDRHRTDRVQWESDVLRYRTLARLGWLVLRWTRGDLSERLARTNAELDGLLRARG